MTTIETTPSNISCADSHIVAAWDTAPQQSRHNLSKPGFRPELTTDWLMTTHGAPVVSRLQAVHLYISDTPPPRRIRGPRPPVSDGGGGLSMGGAANLHPREAACQEASLTSSVMVAMTPGLRE